VEIEETSSDTAGENYTQWRCKNRILPPLLSTSREARGEALKQYTTRSELPEADLEEVKHGLMAPLRFRTNWDTLHLKNFDFSCGEKDFKQSGNHGVGHWESEPSQLARMQFNEEVIERCSMRGFFKNVKGLAVNRETYVGCMSEASWILEYFFPNLILLVILIDDDINVETSKLTFLLSVPDP
jgi:hypothetical protein